MDRDKQQRQVLKKRRRGAKDVSVSGLLSLLPVEATADQRRALTGAFAERLSKGIVGYVAAIHDQHGNDIHNPHAHFVFFDVQQKSGGRGRPRSTLGLARKNAIEETARLPGILCLFTISYANVGL